LAIRTRRFGVIASSVLVAALSGSPATARDTPAQASHPSVDAFALPIDAGAAGLARSLRQLSTRASLIAINAHPDDEDSALLAYESRGVGARTILLTLTRGEGGKNALGDDFGEAFGQIRTQELLAAGRYYGVEQFWGHEFDFGFSKSTEETLRRWGQDRALEDAVRVIRRTRPLVITSSFVGGHTDGHGHHQVAGATAQQAFEAAADPTRFPEQITRDGLRPWRALKVYGRVPVARYVDGGVLSYATGTAVPIRFFNFTSRQWIEGRLSADVRVPVGSPDPLSGSSYSQIARAGLSAQRTQRAGGGAQLPGAADADYHLFASRVAATPAGTDLFAGIDTTIGGIASLAPERDLARLRPSLEAIERAVERASAAYDARNPGTSAPALAEGLGATRSLIARLESGDLRGVEDSARLDILDELRIKARQFNDALVLALGVSATAAVAGGSEDDPGLPAAFGNPLPPSAPSVTAGDPFAVRFIATAQGGGAPLPITRIDLTSTDGRNWSVRPEGATPTVLAPNRRETVLYRLTVPADASPTRPYFHRSTRGAWYDVADPALRNESASPYPLTASLTVEYRGQAITLEQVVQSVTAVDGASDRFDPLVVTPPLSVGIDGGVSVLPLSGGQLDLTAIVRNHTSGPLAGRLRVEAPQGWTVDSGQGLFSLTRFGEEQHVPLRLRAPAGAAPSSGEIKVIAEQGDRRFEEGVRFAAYPGLRPSPVFTPAIHPVRTIDVDIAPNLKIGYVTGSGDTVPEAIRAMGPDVRLLSETDLAVSDLSVYDAVVVGVGAYPARADLLLNNARVLDYVRGGGVLLVQGAAAPYDGLAPYPLTLGGTADRVSEEDAPVTILKPDHPLLQWPNRIGPADFDGWVDERGDRFIADRDPHYEALLESHDTGLRPLDGGLLYARYGRGAFIYSAYAFHRQVPAGVSGGVRLLANILSQGRSVTSPASRP
jgi:LmbE family N-acetylglucosaminyl deacetylase